MKTGAPSGDTSPPPRTEVEDGQTSDGSTATTVPAARPRETRMRLHTAKEWEAMYPIIRHMYITENRKLAEVMTTLERRHEFKAT
jgi:hypothetical protein